MGVVARIFLRFYHIAVCYTPQLELWLQFYEQHHDLSIIYDVLYAISPELFMTKDLGTGNVHHVEAVSLGSQRRLSPSARYTNLATPAPVYISASPVRKAIGIQ